MKLTPRKNKKTIAILNQAFVYVVSRKTYQKQKNALLANEKLKLVLTEIRVEKKLDKVQRLEKIVKERKNSRIAIITLSKDWDLRMALAKSAENSNRMKKHGIDVLPELSFGKTIRENLCPKKRHE